MTNKTTPTPEPTTQERLRDGYDTARTAVADTYQHGRDATVDAARRAADGLEANPLGVLAGGIAIGALVGALIPRSAREKELLAPVGRRIGETARAATQAAREAGFAALDERGLTKGVAKDQARGVVDGLAQALTSAGSAAAQTATGKPTENPED